MGSRPEEGDKTHHRIKFKKIKKKNKTYYDEIPLIRQILEPPNFLPQQSDKSYE